MNKYYVVVQYPDQFNNGKKKQTSFEVFAVNSGAAMNKAIERYILGGKNLKNYTVTEVTLLQKNAEK